MVNSADAELVEVLDDSGRVQRIVTRAEMRRDRLRHRATFVVVIRSSGDIVVHRRAGTKDVWPGRWDVAFGGVAGVGESWTVAAARELAEEAGITDATLEPIGDGWFTDDDVSVVGRIYLARTDAAVAFVDGEVDEAREVSPANLDRFVEEHEFCPDSISLVLPLLR